LFWDRRPKQFQGCAYFGDAEISATLRRRRRRTGCEAESEGGADWSLQSASQSAREDSKFEARGSLARSHR